MVNPRLHAGTLIRVQSWEANERAPERVEQALGVVWPRVTGSMVRGRADIFCIGPTDWLVIARDRDATAVLKRLDTAFEGSALRATDVSSALRRIQIEGAHARELLAKGCGLDVHPQAFPPGRCARTRLAGMPVIVLCVEESILECIVTSSYGDYLLAWLTDADTEFSRTFA